MFKINIPAIIPFTLFTLIIFIVVSFLRRGDDNVLITYSNSSKEEFKVELLSPKAVQGESSRNVSSEVSPDLGSG